MTENKRFIMEESEGQDTIYDNEGLDDYYHLGNDTRDVKALCDLLNEQEETIQDLKCRINSIYAILREEKCSDNRMTEKRFYIEDEHIKDNLEAHNPFYVETYNEAKRFCELLNDLNQEVADAEHYHTVVLENFKAISKDYNKLEDENEQLKKELFEAKKDYLIETSDEVDKALYVEKEIEKLRKEIFE